MEVNKLPTISRRSWRLVQLIAKLSDFDRHSNLSEIDEGAENRFPPNHCIQLEHFKLRHANGVMRMKLIITTTEVW